MSKAQLKKEAILAIQKMQKDNQVFDITHIVHAIYTRCPWWSSYLSENQVYDLAHEVMVENPKKIDPEEARAEDLKRTAFLQERAPIAEPKDASDKVTLEDIMLGGFKRRKR